MAFDGDSQATLADQIGRSFRTRFSALIDEAQAFRRRAVLVLQLGRAGWFWFGVVALAVLTASSAIVVARRRRTVLRRRIGSIDGRELRDAAFYLDVLEAFGILGRPKPESRSPLEHVRTLREDLPEFAREAERLVRAFYEVRFGHRPMDRRRRSEHREAAHRLRLRAAEIGRNGHESTS